MLRELGDTRSRASSVIDQTAALSEARDTIDGKSEVCERFMSEFVWSDEDEVALSSSVFDGRFFEALERVRRIHVRCKMLLRTQHQKAGYVLLCLCALSGTVRAHRRAIIAFAALESPTLCLTR